MNDTEILLREMLDLRRRLERIETTEIASIISLTEIHARSAAGLSIEDDDGNLGVFVEDGGAVGIGTADPDAQLRVVGDTKLGGFTTNYVTIADNGELNLYGAARVKKEIFIPINRTTVGASAPTATTRAVGASGTVKVPVLAFSKTTQQDIHFEVHMPTDVDDTVDATFHLMWFPGASWSTGNFVWKLEYLVVPDSGGTITAGTPTTIASTVTPSAATVAIETEFADAIDANSEQVLWCHLYRDVANDNGDDVGELRFCEVEYTANKLGEPSAPAALISVSETVGSSEASTIDREDATWTVTTTGAETHTIAAFTVSASTTIDWGDGNTNDYTGAGARTHDYAGAGTWTVTVMQPRNVTALTLSDNKVTLNSSGIATMTNMVTFTATGLKAGTFNSSDVATWRPTSFQITAMPAGFAGTFNSADVAAWTITGTFNLNTMPEGYAGTFNSADITAWRPTTFQMNTMPTGYAGTFDSADVSAWRPTTFRLYTMPVATFTITITANGFAAWATGLNDFRMNNNSLSQAQVNAILWDLYQAAKVPRTATGGTISLGNSNAAPSGTYQACASPPVTSSTPGKEIAHELINDTAAVGFNKWTTVTITA